MIRFLAACLVPLSLPALLSAEQAEYRNSQAKPHLLFEEIGTAAGVAHVHRTRRFSGTKADVLRMFTSGGASAAAGDFDGDGRADLFVTDSDLNRPNQLYRNNGDRTFSEVGQEAGVAGGNDDHSIVADAIFLDYDNNGRQDLLVVRFGTPLLYRNRGDGTFEDVSARAGLLRAANSIAAIAFDPDRDGDLDLLFANYFPRVNLFQLPDTRVLPDNLDNASNGGGLIYWSNRGDGTFSEATRQAGLDSVKGWFLDIGHGDLDNDGDQDIYVAGDYGTDRLFLNQGDGRFVDATVEALGGLDTKKGMNAEIADYDNDSRLDIYVTNITDEYMKECNMLWHNNGDGTFSDLSRETGICDTHWGWGAKFADFDNDGWQDLYAVNGLRSAGSENYIPVLFEMIVTPQVDFSDLKSWPDIEDMSWSGYQKSKLFRNESGEIFHDVSGPARVDNELDGRGVVIEDFDGDGRLDIYQTNADQPALLYRNLAPHAGHWLGLRLVGDPDAPFRGKRSSMDAIGARVTVRAGRLVQIREVQCGNGYSGQSGKSVHFGLGAIDRVDAIEVRWPSGRVERIQVPIDRLSKVREGKGAAAVLKQ